jgi:hypothetical protein
MDTNMSATATVELETDGTDMDVEEGAEDNMLREKMIFLLTLYPKLTPTMLHVGIGPQVRPQIWRPVMENLITEGVVKKDHLSLTTPKGQFRTYTVLSLTTPMTIKEWEERSRQKQAQAA